MRLFTVNAIAQQIHLPYDSQQVGPIFFLTGCKVSLFSVVCEPLNTFVLYMILENVQIHLYLFYITYLKILLDEENIEFHADNCVNKNKNNAYEIPDVMSDDKQE